MDNTFLTLVYFSSCGALGITPEIKEFNLKELIKYAKEQSVFSTTFVSVKNLKELSLIDVEENYYKNLSSEFLLKTTTAVKKEAKINKLLLKLKSNGIDCVLLKGLVLSNLYCFPETRQFGDVDILINPSDELKAINLLKSMGFCVKNRSENGNHSECISKTSGVVELHTSLYYNIINEVWFKNELMINEPFTTINGIKSLGVTDGFLYCFLHAVKHFLCGGLSLRQIIDVLLYIKFYKDEINFKRLYSILDKLNYKKFLFTLVGIGYEYMAFTEQDLIHCNYSKEDINIILNDVMLGGVFGKKRKLGNYMYYAYTKERFNKNTNGNFNKYFRKKTRQNIKNEISLNPNNLKKRYYYLNKCILFYPIAVVNHIICLLVKVLKKPYLLKGNIKYSKENTEIINNRLELLNKLNII